jgi:hypothetical protein
MSRINGGALLSTSSMGFEVQRRIFAAANLERSGTNLDEVHPASPVLGAVAELAADFWHRVLLGEVTAEHWAAMAELFADAAQACRTHAGGAA